MTARIGQMMDEFCAYLSENDVLFRRQNRAPAMVTFEQVLNAAPDKITFQVFFSEDGYSVTATMDQTAERKVRASILEYANMINFWEKAGSFEMYSMMGVISYRLEVTHADESPLALETIERSVLLPKKMYEKYGAGFIALMQGTSQNPEEVFRQALAATDPSDIFLPPENHRPRLVVLEGGKGKSASPEKDDSVE